MDTPPMEKGFGTAVSRWFLGACIVLVLYLAYRIVEPYLLTIFLAVALVVLSQPLYAWHLRLFRGRRTPASLVTCFLLCIIILLPLFFIGGMLTGQAFELFNSVSKALKSGELQKTLNTNLGHLQPYFDKLHDSLGISQGDVVNAVGDILRRVSGFLYQNLTKLVASGINVVIGFALVIFVTYYLFKDGEDLAAGAMTFSPLPPDTNQELADEFLRALRNTLRSTVILALINGASSGLGLWIFGVPNALFWGTVMVFASVVPIVGTALVYIPIVIWFLVLGKTAAGIAAGVWCAAVSVVCDNYLRPKLLAGKQQVHPLMAFFSVLGGLMVFGVVGLVLGPLVLAVMIALLEVYREHFISRPAAARAETDRSPAPSPEN